MNNISPSLTSTGKPSNSCFEDSLNCPICLEIFEDPILTGCCGNTFCEKCIKSCKNLCPYCQKKTNYTANRVVKSIISAMPITCQCGTTYIRSEKKNHLEK